MQNARDRVERVPPAAEEKSGEGVGASAPEELGQQLAAQREAGGGTLSFGQQLTVIKEALAATVDSPLLLDDFIDATSCEAQLQQFAAAVQKPRALLLLECEAETLTSEVAQANAATWAAQHRPALVEAAQALQLPLVSVPCNGDFEEQMSNLLVAVSSI